MADTDTETQTTETVTTTPETGANSTPETGAQTQAKTPAELQAELARVEAALKKTNNENASWRKKLEAAEAAETKRKEAEMTELQKAQAKLSEYEKAIKQHEHEKAQTAAASKTGLPAAFADRLKGETPEELEEDAKKLLEALPKANKPAPNLNATNPAGATGGQSEADVRAWLAGGNGGGPFGGGS